VKRKAIYVVISLGLIAFLILYLPRHVWISGYMDGAGDSGPERIGFSITSWKSLNNTRVDEFQVAYVSTQAARKAFDEEMKEAGMRVDGEASARCGRIVRGTGDSEGAVTIVRLLGAEINYIRAGNLKIALAFEGAWIKV
jgi:hypothetical protein